MINTDDTPIELPGDAPKWAAALFDNMTRLHKKVDKNIVRIQKDVDDNKGRLDASDKIISSLTEEYHDQSRIIKALHSKIKDLEARTTNLENYSRRENLLFHNVPDTGATETADKCVTTIRQIMGGLGVSNCETIGIVACHRLGRYDSKRRRPIIVRFVSRIDRDTVFRRRSNCPDNIKISGDLSQITLNRRRYMIPIFIRAKEMDSYKDSVRLIDDKLMVNGKVFTIDNYKSLPDALCPDAVATRTRDNVTIFHSIFSPLSNFHPAPFIAENVCFNNSEQYYNYHKAMICGFRQVAEKILSTSDPAEAHRLGKAVKAPDDLWDTCQMETMKEGLMLKFTQNPELGEFLVRTGDANLGECSQYDTRWGTGMKITDPNAFKPDVWSGRNKLGKLLMDVRTQIADISDT